MTSNSALRSTYICPILYHGRVPIPLIQYAGVLLDLVIVTGAARLLSGSDEHRQKSRRAQTASGLLSAAFILTLGIVLYTVQDFRARKSWAMDLSWTYAGSAFSFAFQFSVIVHLLLYLAPKTRPLSLSVILVFACVYIPEIASAYENRGAFPAQAKGVKFFALLLAFLGTALFVSLEEASESTQTSARISRQMPTLFMSIAATILLFTGILYVSHTNGIGFHPVDLLIYNARLDSESWLKQASSSSTLKGAVKEYKSRYGIQPPPNFDKWYEFAKEHSSMIIDDYDQIWDDLRPFWALQPGQIRAETNRILSNSWNEIAGISIRNGNATVSPHVTPASHRWMVVSNHIF